MLLLTGVLVVVTLMCIVYAAFNDQEEIEKPMDKIKWRGGWNG